MSLNVQVDKELLEDVKRTLKSLLASRTSPITQQQLCCDYVEVTGRVIPYARLGYSNVESLIRDWNDIFKPVWNGTQLLITYRENFTNPHTKNILGLIREQKGGDNVSGLSAANQQQLTRLRTPFIERSIQDRLLSIVSKHTELNRPQLVDLPLYRQFVGDTIDLELISLPELKYLIGKSFPAMNVDFSIKDIHFLKPISIDHLTPDDCNYYHSIEKLCQIYSPGVVSFFVVRLDDDLLQKLNKLFDDNLQLELYCLNELYRVAFEHDIPLKKFGFRSTVDMCDYYSHLCYLENGTTLKRFNLVSKFTDCCKFYKFDFRQNFTAQICSIHDVNSFALQMLSNRLGLVEHVLKKYWFFAHRLNPADTYSEDSFDEGSLLIVNINGKLFRAVCVDKQTMLMFFIDYGWFKSVQLSSLRRPTNELIKTLTAIPAQSIMASFSMVNYPKDVLASYLGFLTRRKILHITVLSQNGSYYNVSLKVDADQGLLEVYDRLTNFQECYRSRSDNDTHAGLVP